MLDQPVWYEDDVEDEFVPISWAHGSTWEEDEDDEGGDDPGRHDFRPHVDDPE